MCECRVQNTRQSRLRVDSSRGVPVKEAGSRGVPVKRTGKQTQRKPVERTPMDCDALPFAFSRAYWLQRKEALHLRLDRLYLETGTSLPDKFCASMILVADGLLCTCVSCTLSN